MSLLNCANLASGQIWQGLFSRFVYPVFWSYGWSDVTDMTSSADMYICFDGVQQKRGITATWLLYKKDFFPCSVEWPTYGGWLQETNNCIVGCQGVQVIVAAAVKNNLLNCQFAGA